MIYLHRFIIRYGSSNLRIINCGTMVVVRPVTFRNFGKAYGNMIVLVWGIVKLESILANISLTGLNSLFSYGFNFMSRIVVVIPVASFASVLRETVHST